jgi:hypothetical protein
MRIAGYTYKADIYCADCVVAEVREDYPQLKNWGGMVGVHDELVALAEGLHIDYEDESSFDSGDFPKVIFSDQIENAEFCCQCRNEVD